ncbi:MAG: elongation factor P [Patescibacteria group bacterium]
MGIIKGGNIRKNSYILFKNDPHIVTKTEFVSPGKGSAFTRARLKSVKTGNSIDFTFKSTESVEELDVNTRQMQFLYSDQEEVAFMDPRSYEQVTIPRALIEDKLGYLTSDSEVYILFYDEKAIGVRVPLKVRLKVTYTEDATAGNRVNAPKKPVTLETGLIVQAPLFSKVGDYLIIDTDTGEYVSRANE